MSEGYWTIGTAILFKKCRANHVQPKSSPFKETISDLTKTRSHLIKCAVSDGVGAQKALCFIRKTTFSSEFGKVFA